MRPIREVVTLGENPSNLDAEADRLVPDEWPSTKQNIAMELHTYVSRNRNISMPTMSHAKKLLSALLLFFVASFQVAVDSNAQWSSNVQLVVPMSANASASTSDIQEASQEAEESGGVTVSFENNDLVKEALEGLFQRMREEDIEIMVAQDYVGGDEPMEMPMNEMYDTISNHRHFDGLVRGALVNVNEIILGYDLRTTRRGPVQDVSEIVISITDSQGIPREVGYVEDQQLIDSLISTGEVNTSYINQQETMTYGDVLTFENVVTDPRRKVKLHRLNGNRPGDLVSGASGSGGLTDEVNRQILEEVLSVWRSRSGRG